MLAAAILIAVPALAQKIHVDYDTDAVHKDYKTFAWGETPQTSLEASDPLMHSRLKNGIEHYLTQGGLTEVSSNPDLYVTYHTSSKQEFNVDTDYWGYGYGPRWRWGPYWGGRYGTTTAAVVQYERGTLVVDLWDAKAKKLVWRGSAEAVIPGNPQKQQKLIDKTLKKMVDTWQKMKRKWEKGQP